MDDRRSAWNQEHSGAWKHKDEQKQIQMQNSYNSPLT